MDELKLIALFETTYRKYYKRIRFYAYSFLNDMDEAESVAQETFMKLWERRFSLDTGKDFFPYLLTIAKNKCLNVIRSKKYFNSYTDYRIMKFNERILSGSFSNSVFEMEVMALIDKSIKEMPPKVKETFILSRTKGLKNKEIADLLQINIRTVELRISHAYRVLNKVLKDYLPFIIWFFVYQG